MTREHWMGYLLGALDEDEQALVERQIAHNPQAAEELDQLRSHLLLLSDGLDEAAPPPGLAARTCALLENPALLAQVVDTAVPADEDAPRPKSRGTFESLGAGGSRFSLLDTVVALGVCIAAAFIFFPTLASSRTLASRLQCENNLRRVGVALQEFASANADHRYPTIAPHGPLSVAGAYAPQLLSDGFLRYPERLQCAEKKTMLGQQTLPTVQQLLDAPQHDLEQMQAKLAAVYNYNLGIQKNGEVIGPEMRGRARYPVASDNLFVQGGAISPMAHADGRFNILFDDGHVEFIALEDLPGPMNHFFLNDEGKVAAGLSEDDPVVAIGTAHPLATTDPGLRP